MDGGENVSNGYYPVAYTAFERKHMGWSDYVEMEDGKTYSLTTAIDSRLRIETCSAEKRLVGVELTDEHCAFHTFAIVRTCLP